MSSDLPFLLGSGLMGVLGQVLLTMGYKNVKCQGRIHGFFVAHYLCCHHGVLFLFRSTFNPDPRRRLSDHRCHYWNQCLAEQDHGKSDERRSSYAVLQFCSSAVLQSCSLAVRLHQQSRSRAACGQVSVFSVQYSLSSVLFVTE